MGALCALAATGGCDLPDLRAEAAQGSALRADPGDCPVPDGATPPIPNGTRLYGELEWAAGDSSRGSFLEFGATFTGKTKLEARGAHPIAAGDLDGDGKDELVQLGLDDMLRVVRTDGRRRYLTTLSGPVSLDVGDLDRDGRQEVVTVAGPREISLVSDSGELTPVEGTDLGEDRVGDVCLGDFDGDGALELAAVRTPWDGSGSRELLLGEYDPRARRVAWTATTVANALAALDCGDVDGDHRDDIVGLWPGSTWRYAVAHVFGVTNGQTLTGVEKLVEVSTHASRAWDLAVGDTNADGLAEIAVQASTLSSARAHWYSWDGSALKSDGHTEGPTSLRSGPELRWIVLGDWDGDSARVELTSEAVEIGVSEINPIAVMIVPPFYRRDQQASRAYVTFGEASSREERSQSESFWYLKGGLGFETKHPWVKVEVDVVGRYLSGAIEARGERKQRLVSRTHGEGSHAVVVAYACNAAFVYRLRANRGEMAAMDGRRVAVLSPTGVITKMVHLDHYNANRGEMPEIRVPHEPGRPETYYPLRGGGRDLSGAAIQRIDRDAAPPEGLSYYVIEPGAPSGIDLERLGDGGQRFTDEHQNSRGLRLDLMWSRESGEGSRTSWDVDLNARVKLGPDVFAGRVTVGGGGGGVTVDQTVSATSLLFSAGIPNFTDDQAFRARGYTVSPYLYYAPIGDRRVLVMDYLVRLNEGECVPGAGQFSEDDGGGAEFGEGEGGEDDGGGAELGEGAGGGEEETCPLADALACDGLDGAGRCADDGATVEWCQNGRRESLGCDEGESCAWSDDEAGYACVADVPEPCGQVDEAGGCDDEGRVVWCGDDGSLRALTCAADEHCDWSPEAWQAMCLPGEAAPDRFPGEPCDPDLDELGACDGPSAVVWCDLDGIIARMECDGDSACAWGDGSTGYTCATADLVADDDGDWADPDEPAPPEEEWDEEDDAPPDDDPDDPAIDPWQADDPVEEAGGDECGDVTAEGDCVDDWTAEWCEGGVVMTDACAPGSSCGWLDGVGAACVPDDDGRGAPDQGCGDVTWEGECADTWTVLWCEDGELRTLDCPDGQVCDVDADGITTCLPF